MKPITGKRYAFAFGAAATLSLIFAPLAPATASDFAGPRQEQQAQGSQVSLPAAEKQAVDAFEGRVKEYAKMREGLEEKLPKLSKEAKPEEITAHKVQFMEMVRNSRVGAKPGDLFAPEIAAHIRAIIKDEFKGRERQELRKEVMEADNKRVPLRVNYSYPETEELVDMPPTLLLRFPQLPKQVRYRFVRGHLLLVDRENGLIIDYMPNALP